MTSLIAGLSFVLKSHCVERGLGDYVNKDLTKLTKAEKKQFAKSLNSIVKEKPDPRTWQVPIPRWIKSYPVGQSKWLYLSYCEAMSVPGSGTVQIYGFTNNWKKTFSSSFYTGYRLSPTKIRLINMPDSGIPILHIHVESLGPFVVEGKHSRPAFQPATGIDLYCAFNDQGGHLVRVTSGDGTLMGNSFHNGFSSLGGPEFSPKGADVLNADLHSEETIRQLRTITWLSSFHLNSKDWRKDGYARESVESSLLFETMRSDSKVIKRLKELERSPFLWVRQESTFALKNLARPLAPKEAAPNSGE